MLIPIAEPPFPQRSITVIEAIGAVNSAIIPRMAEGELLKVCMKKERIIRRYYKDITLH